MDVGKEKPYVEKGRSGRCLVGGDGNISEEIICVSENSTMYLSTACQNLVLRIVRKNLHNGSDHFGFLTVQFVIGTPPSTGATWKRSSVGSSPVMTRTESTHAVASTSPLRRSGMASQIFV